MHSEGTQSPVCIPDPPLVTPPGTQRPSRPAKLGQPTPSCELTATDPDQPTPEAPAMHVHQNKSPHRTGPAQNQSSHRTRPTPHRTRPPTAPAAQSGPRGGFRGVVPPEKHC